MFEFLRNLSLFKKKLSYTNLYHKDKCVFVMNTCQFHPTPENLHPN